ncbi:hypothetical protein EDB86DRAFT_2959934 [Lactarius hatsudake]|nr:hypothetical protein EDB86DRAFT_2959934 [Lactarius hatsudake]
MVHRPSDLRLLNSLLSNEKEYHKQLLVLLDTHSQQSLGAFAAYASASPAPVARALIAVAGSFAGADDALRRYAASVETWHAELRALKDLEEEVKNVMRDREILVTRLIKVSKNQKPTRDSFIGNLGSATSDASLTSLNSFTPAVVSSSKLASAQAELQACESHLASKEKELDQLRASTVRRGLEARCKAMVECGWNWGEMGKEGLRALEGMENPPENGNDVSSHYHKLLPDPDRPPGSDLSSIGPSQSASQIHLPTLSSAMFTDQPASTPPRTSSPSPFPPRSSSPHTGMPLPSSFTLQIPPAHSISEFTLPSTVSRRISEEQEEADENSSDEDSRPVEVVENVRFKAGVGASASTSNVNTARRFSLRGTRPRDNSGSNTTSSGTGTGTGSFSQHASSTLAPSHPSTHFSLPHVPLAAPLRERKGSGGFFSSIAGLFRGSGNTGGSGAEKWRTRTEANLRAVRRNADSDSEDEGTAESPSRRFFGRRVSHDLPPPSPIAPSPQKLRKRSARERERDGGWISDGATVAGRGARKGSIKQRPSLPGAYPSTSGHQRSSSVPSANPSFVSASGSSTPTRAKPKAKPKTDLRVETLSRSSTTDVSRQGILRSSESVPPVPKLPGPGERSSYLPPSQSTLGSNVSRSSSLAHHGKSSSTLNASIPPPSRGDAGQTSLLAIVESLTRDNRAAWDRANSSLSLDGAGHPVGGLVSARAPPSVSKYNLRGEGGHGIAFESVLVPSSVLAAQPPSSSARSGPQRATSLPPLSHAPVPMTPAATGAKPPLRSALRNQSPPPVPPPKPIVIPSAPPRVIAEAAPLKTNGRDNNDDEDDDGSDSGSIASFQTVRETLDDEPTPVPPPAPAPPAVAAALVLPGRDDSDVSASTISLGTGAGANGATRRKSVRMSLQPTFSPTPPALDEDEDEAWGRSGRPWGVAVGNGNGGPGVGGKERERDFWADSSDEDEEYSNARKLLTRAGKKRW